MPVRTPQTIALRILARKGDPDAIAELIRRWVDLRWDSRGADLTEYPYRMETQPYKTAWARWGPAVSARRGRMPRAQVS